MAATRGRKKAVSKTAEKLAKALTFCSNAITEGKETYKEHGRIINGYLVTFNGTVAAGHPVDEELRLCPHIGNFVTALNKAGKTLTITETDNGNIQIKGDNLRATVPCLPHEDMPPIMPDMQIAVIDDNIKEGFRKLLPLTVDESDKIHEYSILLRGNSMVATNGKAMFEFWHGIDLPPDVYVMRAGAEAVCKVAEPLTGFGWTPGRSVTFWFEGGAFYQTMLASGQWPAVDGILNAPGEPKDLPPAFFEAIETVASFSKDGAVHFADDKMRSGFASYGDEGPVYGAVYDVPGLVGKSSFSRDMLKLIKPVCEKIDYWTNEDRALFYGPIANGEQMPRLRGILMKRG